MADAVAQYLSRYAEPEASQCQTRGSWASVVVVPACDEDPASVRGILAARERVLLIVVVNAASNASEAVHHRNLALLRALGSRDDGPVVQFVAGPEIDCVIIDRARGTRRLPEGQGVGMARKIGLDVALRLWVEGRVESPWLRTTDADASLRWDGGGATVHDAVARIAPFWHERSGDLELDRATARYEVWLRYYVAGLRHAGSPWAMPTIGSTLEISAPHYARVRGMPRRAAGEDFHVLAKLAKLGPVQLGGPARVSLRARYSARVPFGTGPAVARATRSGAVQHAYDPTIFDLLAEVERALDAVADPQGPALEEVIGSSDGRAVLRELGLPAVVSKVRAQPDPRVRSRRIHEWFDATRTLRFVHGLRARGRPDLPWFEAVDRAAFVPSLAYDRDDPDLVELRRVLEGLMPERAGLGVARASAPGRARARR